MSPPPVPGRMRYDPTGSSFVDGDAPIAFPVRLVVDSIQEVLEIEVLDGRDTRVNWPLKEVREVLDVAGREGYMLRWTGDPLARLHLANPFILNHLPLRKRRAPPKGRGRLAAWAVAAVASVGLQIGVLVPLLADRLAVYIPPEGERALGETTFEQIREALAGTGLPPLATCDDPDGLEALQRMMARLNEGHELPQDINVFVLDHQMINAFALPGGFVVFFRGLIEAAESPNEVASVMAHEIGHVANRDPTRHAMRSAGSIGILGLLFGDFAGGAAVLFLTERLISAKYSQEAETGADSFAHEALERANVSPAALGDMFDRLRKKYGDNDGITAHFLSHPAIGDRIERARAAAREGADYGQIISDEDWQLIKGVCGDSKPRKKSLDEMDDSDLLPPVTDD